MSEKHWGTTSVVLLVIGVVLVIVGLLYRPSGLGGAFCGSFVSAITSGCMNLNRVGDYGYAPAVVFLIAGLVLAVGGLAKSSSG
jgi:hypothetical protein